MKKLELLDGVIEQFGLTPQEVIAHLSKKIEMPTAKKIKKSLVIPTKKTEMPTAKKIKKSLVIPTKKTEMPTAKKIKKSLVIPTKKIEMPTIIPAKKFVTPSHIEAGMFHYAEENLIFPEIIPELIIDSVIGFWDTNEGIALCRDQEEMPWSSDNIKVANANVKSGFKATQMILEAVKKTGKPAEAAQYCARYAKYGIKAGQAFLFSKFEAEKVLPNVSRVRKAFALLKDEPLGRYLWSSSECNNTSAWFYCSDSEASTGGLFAATKYYDCEVRPALALKI